MVLDLDALGPRVEDRILGDGDATLIVARKESGSSLREPQLPQKFP